MRLDSHNSRHLPLFLIAPVRFLRVPQHDIRNLEGGTTFSQLGRRDLLLRPWRSERVIRNLVSGICFCVRAAQNPYFRSWTPKPAFAKLTTRTCFCDSDQPNSTFENRGLKSDIREPVSQIRHLRSGLSKLTFRMSRHGTRFSDSGSRNLHLRIARPKVRKWKSEPETEKVKPEARFWKSGIAATKSENRLPRAESVKATSRPQICKSKCHGLALVFGESATQTRNVRTGGAKVQKRVGPFGIAKTLHGNGLGTINNAAFRRTETEHVRLRTRRGVSGDWRWIILKIGRSSVRGHTDEDGAPLARSKELDVLGQHGQHQLHECHRITLGDLVKDAVTIVALPRANNSVA